MGRQRSAGEWRREVEAWRSSGASAATFAKLRGYSVSSLMRRSREVPTQSFMRLEVVPSEERRPAGLVIAIRGAEVRVEHGFDAELLRGVVDALSTRSAE